MADQVSPPTPTEAHRERARKWFFSGHTDLLEAIAREFASVEAPLRAEIKTLRAEMDAQCTTATHLTHPEGCAVRLGIELGALAKERAANAKDEDGLAVVEIISGVAGPCIAINGLRVAGPKPYGGSVIAHRWIIERKQLADALGRALPEWAKPPPVPPKTSKRSRR